MDGVCLKKLAIFLTLIALSAGAVSSAPASDCIPTLMSLANCGNFVMVGSKESEPDGACCGGLQNVLKSDEKSGTHNGLKCLCDAFNNGGGVGIQLNKTKSSSVLGLCALTLPPGHNCTSGHAPAPVPAPSQPTVPPNPSSGSLSPAASMEMFVCTAVAAVFFMYQPKS